MKRVSIGGSYVGDLFDTPDEISAFFLFILGLLPVYSRRRKRVTTEL